MRAFNLEMLRLRDGMESNLLHRRIYHHLTALILDQDYRDGDVLPSVRSLASELNANPLTVAKAYQPLLGAGVVVARRGMGFFVASGGAQRLREMERERFLKEVWPGIAAKVRHLGVTPAELIDAGAAAASIVEQN